MAYKEPNVKDKSLDNKLSQNEIEFLIELRAKMIKDDEDRAQWKMKMIASHNQRLGIKQMVDYPWENAPNIPLPETDKLIKKAIPNLVLSSWAPKKLATVKVKQGTKPNPQWEDMAKRAEGALNLVLRNEMDLFDKLELAADYAKEKGHCLFRVVEEYKCTMVHRVINLEDYPEEQIKALKQMKNPELQMFVADRYSLDLEDEDDREVIKDVVAQFRSGKDIIEFETEEITSLPNIEVPLPTKVVVPGWVTDIRRSPRITYEYFLTRYEIEAKMKQGVFLEKDMEHMSFANSKKEDADLVEHQKGWNEGIADNTSEGDLYRVHEVCVFYKPDGDEYARKWVYTFFADILDVEEAMLQKLEFPYEFDDDTWNWEKYDNERKDERYYNSRGVPEQIRAIQEIMERSVNNIIIRDELNNNPTYEVVDTSEILDMHTRLVPGEFLPVKAIGQEIRKLNDPISVDISSERIMQLLKAYAEEYLGSTDQLFRNATNAGGGKTLGEVREGIRQASGPTNIEVIRWNQCLSRVYRKVFDIMKERLGDSIWVDGIEVTREDFNFPAEVRSNGQLEVADADRATMKAWNRLTALTNEALADCVDSEDKYNAIKDWLEKDGVKDPDEFSTHPMEIAQKQLTQIQQQVQQLAVQAQMLQKANESATKELAKTKKSVYKERVNDIVEFERNMTSGGNGGKK